MYINMTILTYLSTIYPDTYNTIGIGIGFILSTFIFVVSSYNKRGIREGNGEASYQWISRIVSNYHAIFISVTSTLFLLCTALQGGERTIYELIFELDSIPRPLWLNQIWYLFLGISSGYLFYDLMLVIVLLNRDIGTITHHAIVAPFLVWLRTDYPIYAAIGMLSEISTPFLNACWFELHRDYPNRGKLLHLSYLLLVTYFIFRVLLFPYICLMSMVKEEHYAVPLCIIVALLNIYWFYRLLLKSRSMKSILDQPV